MDAEANGRDAEAFHEIEAPLEGAGTVLKPGVVLDAVLDAGGGRCRSDVQRHGDGGQGTDQGASPHSAEATRLCHSKT